MFENKLVTFQIERFHTEWQAENNHVRTWPQDEKTENCIGYQIHFLEEMVSTGYL